MTRLPVGFFLAAAACFIVGGFLASPVAGWIMAGVLLGAAGVLTFDRGDR